MSIIHLVSLLPPPAFIRGRELGSESEIRFSFSKADDTALPSQHARRLFRPRLGQASVSIFSHLPPVNPKALQKNAPPLTPRVPDTPKLPASTFRKMFASKLAPLDTEELEPLSPSHNRRIKRSSVTKAFGVDYAGSGDIGAGAGWASDLHVPVARAVMTRDWSSVAWGRRPHPNGVPTPISVVVAFKRWDVDSGSGKEVLTWRGVLECYWVDARLAGYPVEKGMPEEVWRPKTLGSSGLNLGAAEKCKQVSECKERSRRS